MKRKTIILFLFLMLCLLCFGCNILNKERTEKDNEQESFDLKKDENESLDKTLKEKTYDLSDGTIRMVYTENEEKELSYIVYLDLKQDWQAASCFTGLKILFEQDVFKQINSNFFIHTEKASLTPNISMYDSQLINVIDWLTEQISSEEYNQESADILWKEIENSIIDFWEKID